MAAHAAHELFVHLNWHVKDNRPILKGDVELMVHRAVTDRCKNLKGVKLHAVNGTEDHLHLVVEYEPYLSISKIVGDIKGGSSFEANKRIMPAVQRTIAWRTRERICQKAGKRKLAKADWKLGCLANHPPAKAGGN